MSERKSPLLRVNRAMYSTVSEADAGVLLSEIAFLGYLNLRGNPDDTVFCTVCERVLSCALPTQPNTVSTADSVSVYWLGPDEWLIITSAEQCASLERSLRQAFGQITAAVTDISSGQTLIRIAGEQAVWVLRKACTLDLHSGVLSSETCQQTVLANVDVIVRLRSDHAYELIVRRSFAEYLWRWLQDAAQEYGFAITAS